MRFVFIIYNALDSGAVMSASRRQAEFLASRGHAVQILSNQVPAWNGTESVSIVSSQSAFGKFVEYALNGLCRRLPYSFDLRKLAAQKRFVRAAFTTMKEMCPDLFICCQHFCSPALLKIKKRYGIPFVQISHGGIFSHPKKSFPIALRCWYQQSALQSLPVWLNRPFGVALFRKMFQLCITVLH